MGLKPVGAEGVPVGVPDIWGIQAKPAVAVVAGEPTPRVTNPLAAECGSTLEV
jgi:hypothetical protein